MNTWIQDTIGKRYRAFDGLVYAIESHEENHGFWMSEIGNPSNRRNVSERAIGRTLHEVKIESAPADPH